jgi:hypothetical protein
MKINITLTLILMLIGTLVWGTPTVLGQTRAVEDGLVSYWSFDKETIVGKRVRDLWGDNDGTIEGDPKVVKGKFGDALEFTPANMDAVNIGDPRDNSLDFGKMTDFTLEAWVKPENSGVSMRVIDKKDDTDTGYMIEHNITEGFQPYASDGQGEVSRVLEGKTHFGEGWIHFVGVFARKGDIELYINADLIKSKEMDSPGKENISNSSPFYIGRRPSGEYWFGCLDEIRVYKRALSEEEIENNFRAQGLAVESFGKVAITWGRIKDSR